MEKEEIIDYLAANKKIIEFHEKIQDFASHVNQEVVEINNNIHPKPTAGGALWSISADIFALHRSIFSLCSGGWAVAVPIILRTMMELYLSILIIAKDIEESEYFGFKYLYSFHKNILKDKDSSMENLSESKRKINEGFKKLDDITKEKAKHFVYRQKVGAYWYQPEYKSPSDVLDKISNEAATQIYKLLSGASHGGFGGLRFFKGESGDIHPNPRADSFSQNLVLSYSSRIMLEALFVVGNFGGVTLQDRFDILFNELKSLKTLVDSQITKQSS